MTAASTCRAALLAMGLAACARMAPATATGSASGATREPPGASTARAEPADAGAPAAKRPEPAAARLERLLHRYAELLARHRPDLAERYGANASDGHFVPLDEASVVPHLDELQRLLAEALTLPAGARADSLRARLGREIAETEPGGALRRDALLWLDIVNAAARVPFEAGGPRGCDRTRRAAQELRTLPEALRAATVLLRGAPAPDPDSLEARLAGLERLLRQDLPARTEACRESRWRAEFVEADSLAAASLAEFRRWQVQRK